MTTFCFIDVNTSIFLIICKFVPKIYLIDNKKQDIHTMILIKGNVSYFSLHFCVFCCVLFVGIILLLRHLCFRRELCDLAFYKNNPPREGLGDVKLLIEVLKQQNVQKKKKTEKANVGTVRPLRNFSS